MGYGKRASLLPAERSGSEPGSALEYPKQKNTEEFTSDLSWVITNN
jgi:hypothetical protein